MLAAYTLAAPYSLPWYDVLAWRPAGAAATPLDVAAGRALAVVTLAYVPGRVVA